MTRPAVNPSTFGPRQAQPLEGFIHDAQSILQGLFAPPNSQDMPAMARAQLDLDDQIARIAAAKFADGEGRAVLEYLCDKTLRRPVCLYQPGLSAETVALYGVMREGQNQGIAMLLALIARGRGEQSSPREGS